MFKFFRVSEEEKKKFFSLPEVKTTSEDGKRILTYRLLKRGKKWDYYLVHPDFNFGIKKAK